MEQKLLLVGRKTPGDYPEIINAFEGSEATDIYNGLVKRGDENA